MPLSINVGLSRKASMDYQSSGASINIVAELDQSLLARPDELQRQIDDLYQQAEDAISRNAVASPPPPARSNGRSDRRANGSGNGHGNGQGNSTGNGRRNGSGGGGGGGGGRGGGMTDSQRRAIEAIARRIDVDPFLESRDIVGVDLDALSVRQASELIDHLKSIAPAGAGRG